MPSTRTTRSSHLLHPYSQPLTMYEYDDLTKNLDDAHKFLNAVDKKLKGDVDFLDHVLRTTRQMEGALADQRQVATNIFNRLIRHGFEQETQELVHRLRRKRVHPSSPSVPKPYPKGRTHPDSTPSRFQNCKKNRSKIPNNIDYSISHSTRLPFRLPHPATKSHRLLPQSHSCGRR